MREKGQKMTKKEPISKKTEKTTKTTSRKPRTVTKKKAPEPKIEAPKILTRDELKARYIAEIRKNCETVKTYKPSFDPIIDTLAQTLVERDAAQAFYELNGAMPVTEHSGRDGINLRQNPALRTIIELNHSALEYWRELGLTPKSLKSLNEEMNKTEKPTDFSAMISKLASGN